ncbi:hypothetical protein AVEN_115509-1 [Araneus ventricosus]|uniref:Uncharacterized protein n=1 Tax=Araneus ventricosus TaxID=182803 RepID=A0A4Y2CIE7_ARAVE|nr:hypothetical protein AVEN_115509-1 [Araneus ventricosus]
MTGLLRESEKKPNEKGKGGSCAKRELRKTQLKIILFQTELILNNVKRVMKGRVCFPLCREEEEEWMQRCVLMRRRRNLISCCWKGAPRAFSAAEYSEQCFGAADWLATASPEPPFANVYPWQPKAPKMNPTHRSRRVKNIPKFQV